VVRSRVLPGFQLRISDLIRRPDPDAMRRDPVYSGFVLPAWTRAEQARELAERERDTVARERDTAARERDRVAQERDEAFAAARREAAARAEAEAELARLRAAADAGKGG
jgi:hypothetical protein